MIALILTLVIYALIFYVLWWALGALALPEPFNKIITVILVIAVVYVLIGVLTGSIVAFPALGKL